MINNDCVFNILGYLNVEELSKSRLVCSSWQTIADQNIFWHSHLQSIKGKDFTACILDNPRNFIRLDQQLTKIFCEVVNLKKHYLASHKPQLSLINIDQGIVNIQLKDMEIETFTLRLSNENIETLKNDSCLDYDAWKKNLEKLSDFLSSQMHPKTNPDFTNRPKFKSKF